MLAVWNLCSMILQTRRGVKGPRRPLCRAQQECQSVGAAAANRRPNKAAAVVTTLVVVRMAAKTALQRYPTGPTRRMRTVGVAGMHDWPLETRRLESLLRCVRYLKGIAPSAARIGSVVSLGRRSAIRGAGFPACRGCAGEIDGLESPSHGHVGQASQPAVAAPARLTGSKAHPTGMWGRLPNLPRLHRRD